MALWSSRTAETLVVALVALSLSFGCSHGDKRETTLEEVVLTPTDLASMTLTQQELGAAYENFVPRPNSGLSSNKEAVTQAPEFRRDWVTEGIVSSGRRSGYSRFFFAGTDLTDAAGVWLIGSSVQVYEQDTGAADAFEDTKNEPLADVGSLRLEQTRIGNWVPFDPPQLGDAWFGQTLSIESAVTPGSRTYWTRIIFSEGSVLGSVLAISSDDRDLRDEVRSLASTLEEKISSVLRGEEVQAEPLTARDVLVQAQAELERVSSIHLSQQQDVVFEGKAQSWSLDLDVEFPDRAMGQMNASGEQPLSLLAQGPSAYIGDAAKGQEAWRCFEAAAGLSPRQAGLTVPDFWAEVDLVSLAPDPPMRTEIDSTGRQVYVVDLRVDALEYLRNVSGLLAATGPVPPDLRTVESGTALIRLYIGVDDFLMRRYVVDLSYATSDLVTVTVDTDVAVSDFNASPRFPEVGVLPDCSYLDPPCYGRNVDSCLRPSDALQPPNLARSACEGSERRVCLVPMGAVPPELLQSLTAYYKRELGLDVKVLPGAVLLQQEMDQEKHQFDAAVLESLMEGNYPNLASDPNVVLIGITPLDMTRLDQLNLNFLFGQRFGEGADSRFGVISYFRMNPQSYGEPPDQVLLETRLRKMVTRYIGSLYYGLPDNSDPQSVLYESIGGLTYLDRIGERLPAPAGP
jgi:predicted Zn-dependent protease